MSATDGPRYVRCLDLGEWASRNADSDQSAAQRVEAVGAGLDYLEAEGVRMVADWPPALARGVQADKVAGDAADYLLRVAYEQDTAFAERHGLEIPGVLEEEWSSLSVKNRARIVAARNNELLESVLRQFGYEGEFRESATQKFAEQGVVGSSSSSRGR